MSDSNHTAYAQRAVHHVQRALIAPARLFGVLVLLESMGAGELAGSSHA